MKKKVIIILISLIPFICVSYSQEREDEFFRVGRDAAPYIETSWVDTIEHLVLVNSSRFSPAYHITLDSINYMFTVKNGILEYIITGDSNFCINGYKIGTMLNNDYISATTLIHETWEQYKMQVGGLDVNRAHSQATGVENLVSVKKAWVVIFKMIILIQKLGQDLLQEL